MQNLYKSWQPQIQEFFEANNLNYSKVKQCGKAVGIIGGKKTLLLQDIGHIGTADLLDNTPAPIVLRAVEENGSLVFEKTAYTNEYFS